MQSTSSSGSSPRSGDRTPGRGEKKPRPMGLKLPIPPREEPFGRPLPVPLPLPVPVPVPLPLPTPPRPQQQQSHGRQDVDDPKELEKVEILGYGNGGKVYKVRHRITQTLYALKVVHGNHDLSTRSQILREMDILRRTDSPYVVLCHGVFDRGGEIQFVLEYLDGGSLDKKVGQGRHLPEQFLAEVARQVLHGLRYLHGQKIVHRDIKPSNLLINREGRVKIADFGVSKILSKTLDPCNSCVGTYAYMSPERIDPDKNDGHYDGYAGDIWSLGLTLLECYVGRFPFLSPGMQPDWPTLMCAICYGEPPLPPPTASPEFQSFIGCCLQKEASQRWTAAELLTHPFVDRASGSALQNGRGLALQNGSSSPFLARASGSALQNGSS